MEVRIKIAAFSDCFFDNRSLSNLKLKVLEHVPSLLLVVCVLLQSLCLMIWEHRV